MAFCTVHQELFIVQTLPALLYKENTRISLAFVQYGPQTAGRVLKDRTIWMRSKIRFRRPTFHTP